MPGELRLLRMRFDAGRLHQLGRRRRLPPGVELGYLLHCELKELFGDDAPSPFFNPEPAGRAVTVFAYSRRDKRELLDFARTFADPAVYEACDFETMAEKALPVRWEEGRRVGFEVRACPIVRIAKDDGRHRAGAEVDAFLARCTRDEGGVHDRQAVYVDWLQAELARRGGVTPRRIEVTAFSRQRLVRRDHGPERRASTHERPDVLFRGELEITDSEAFGALLERGVGRHRAFGFGMVLLRPVG